MACPLRRWRETRHRSTLDIASPPPLPSTSLATARVDAGLFRRRRGGTPSTTSRRTARGSRRGGAASEKSRRGAWGKMFDYFFDESVGHFEDCCEASVS